MIYLANSPQSAMSSLNLGTNFLAICSVEVLVIKIGKWSLNTGRGKQHQFKAGVRSTLHIVTSNEVKVFRILDNVGDPSLRKFLSFENFSQMFNTEPRIQF